MAQPVADFTANKLSGCSPLTVQFTDLSTGGATSWYWSFGNGNNSTIQNPSATYVTPGVYAVSLKATNAAGNDTKTKTAYITVFSSPVANFTAPTVSGCAPLSVSFNNTSTPGSSPITTWLWDYGDGNLGSTQTPTHVYTSSGTKNVSLTVTDANGCTNNIAKASYITVSNSFTANFSTTTAYFCKAPATTTFTPSVIPANAAYTYLWTTTDGKSSTQQIPSFTFSQGGFIGVTLKVSLPNGCQETVVKNQAVQLVNLKANFDLPPQPYCEGKNFQFINKTTPDSSNVNYVWQVDNGSLFATKDLSINLAAGNKTIKLISGYASCLDTVIKTITVNPNPKASFNLSPENICKVPAKINVTSTSTGNGLSYFWMFGNTQTSTNAIDSVVYTSFLTYTPKLTVTDINGCRDSVSKQVQAKEAKAQIMSTNGFKGCKPFISVFKERVPKDFVSFEWKINGVIMGTDSMVGYTFQDTGKYVITLKATNAEGCVSIVTDTVRVGLSLDIDFTANKRTGCYAYLNEYQFTLTETSGLSNLIYKWEWRNGTDNKRDPNITFRDTGSYDVKVIVEHNGCSTVVEKSKYITITPAYAKLEQPDVFCGNDSVKFIGNLSIGKNKFWWYFGDGDSSTEKNPYHQYRASGVYDVKLIVLDTVHNCPDTATMKVVIPESPLLNFRVKDSIGCSPLKVTLENTSIIGPNGFNIITTEWKFNTNEVAVGKTASLSLGGTEWRSLTMKVTDARNCVFELKKDSVAKPSMGQAVFAITPGNLCIPALVKVSETSTSDYPIIQRKWQWTSTDSSVFDTARTASFAYTKANSPQSAGYQIKLTIKDSIGCVYTTTKPVIPTLPVPKISIARNITCGRQTITASANTTSNNVFTPAVYTWSMGVGPNITSSSFIRSFIQQDTIVHYSLIITDANGCSKSADTVIRVVNRKPDVGFYANPQKLECYTPVRPIKLFDTTVIGALPIAEWKWKIGSNVSSLKNPEVTFTKPGKYPVSLIVKDSAGCIDTLDMPDYLLLGGPVGSYSFTPKVGCTPHQVNFMVNSPNAKYYIWDFGDGLVDTVPGNSYNYTYTNADEYYPRLTLVDSSGTCAYGYDAIDSIVVHPLPEPDFTADKNVICYNSSVVFTNTTPNQPKIKNWLWIVAATDTSKVLGPVTHLFPLAGKYEVSLMATDTNGCIDTIVKPDFITVIDDTIPPDVPITFRATVNSNTQNQFEFNKSTAIDYAKYRVFYNYAGNQPLNWADVLPVDDTVFLQNNINTLENTYTYGVTATDLCGNQSDTSILHTTVELKATSINNGIGLAWTNYIGFDTIKRYEIWRNNPDSGNQFTYIAQTDAATQNYTDTNVSCHTVYYYKIKTINQADTIFSWSDTSGAVPIFVPTVPDTKNIRVTVVKDSYVLLQWQKRIHKIGFEYAIYRMRDDETTPQFYKATKDTFLIDKDVNVDQHSYSYYTYLKDVCGGVSSPSNEAKTILLKVDLKQNDILKYDPIISFSNYKHWDDGIKNYQAYFYYDSAKAFDVISSLTITDNTFFHKYIQLEQIDYCYKVEAFNAMNDKVTSESNIACVETKPRLYAPSAFSINGDGVNDKFKLGGVFLETYHITIYDRWGKLVFESYDINTSWDGTFDGKPCPPDVYVYIAEGTGRRNQQVVIKGNVSLLR